ncbi:helix-turn-helix domain-containing protein [Novosphingobium sp. JCM 18896]|uniref:helix-turn-helix domain-containing protein n=1 Tax=Novosphingobium sp. JCM 18896 TaxID=2989731 RepID=UPI002221FAA3|nr:helix-turn-helix transcriptional regulator [Novosphingobium sp. JCM 18896]MCW1430747.1 helix-turn-helix transcriptional regulator [Novosphingobium sp. JCM 18896]
MTELRSAENETIATRLREELARRRISRQALADMARISLSTLEKALSGARPFTLATVVRIEDVLGTSLRQVAATSAPDALLAPEAMGSYSRPAVRWIEGSYLTLRPAFSQPDAVYAYRTEIFWDEPSGHLRFAESERADSAFTQAGFVSMPNLSGHTYLVTSEEGQYRLVMLGRATRERRMFGLLSTLQVGSGSQLIPVACPIALVPLDQTASLQFGLVDDAAYRDLLAQATASDFCRWHG